ncbi:hypothetical protein [Thermomicrobium sp.]
MDVKDLRDLVRLLEEHPEWRAELRRLLLSEEIVRLPEEVAQLSRDIRELRAVTSELIAAHTAALERFTRVEQAIAALRETVEAEAAQARALQETVRQETEQVREHSRQIGELREAVAEHSRQIAQLRATVEEHSRQIGELREAVAEHSEQLREHSRQIAELRATVERLTQEFVQFREAVEQRFLRVEARLDRVENRLDQLVGITLELRSQQRLSSWLGFVLEKIKVRPPGDWAEQLRPLVGAAVFDEVLDADLLVRGRLRRDPSIELWLVVEVSGVVDRTDVERAVTRAMVLQPALKRVVPLVVGERATEGAMELADRLDVVTLLNGRMQNWEEAAARWVA